MKKRFLTLIVTITAMLACLFGFIACEDSATDDDKSTNTEQDFNNSNSSGGNTNGGSSNSNVPVSYVTLNRSNLTLEVGDSASLGEQKVLIADLVQQEGAQLTFTSSDESVATVDEYGWVTAIKEGTATITAKYGDASDTCEVTVSLNGMLPLLQLPNVPNTQVSISRESSLDLSGRVLFNGKTYDDVTLAYQVSDTSVGTIENGVFKPIKSGRTEITVCVRFGGIQKVPQRQIPRLSRRLRESNCVREKVRAGFGRKWRNRYYGSIGRRVDFPYAVFE